MIENLPNWINLLFFATWLFTLLFFYYANGQSGKLIIGLLLWSAFQSILAYTGFYQDTESIPPRFAVVIIPVFVVLGYGLLPKQQKWISENRNTKISTFLHIVRLPVEIVLWQLFIYQMIPELMTFEGRNFDILAGITAPVLGFLFLKNIIGNKLLLLWNFVGLLLVFFIFVNGIISAELPFQQFGFDQPNRAIVYFPFILLPAVIVPIVIWTHLTDILILWKGKDD